MDRTGILYGDFVRELGVEPTSCQDRLLRDIAEFICGDDSDILVVNGFAGTGKTTAVSAVIRSLRMHRIHSVLLAPTGRAAKVLEQYSSRPAATIHKHIYRQSSVGADGYGQFKLAPNKARNTLFVVDEVSLIGIEDAQRQSTMLFGTGNLLEDLVNFVRAGDDCRLILIGDSAQLPPVGLDSSPALSPEYMENFGGVRLSRLTTVVRQALESGILANATALREVIDSARSSSQDARIRLSVKGFPDVCRIRGGELVECIGDAYSKYGEDNTIILCRSNRKAIRYNMGIRSMVQFKEEKLVRDDRLMIVRNCYQFVEEADGLDYIANGDIAKLVRIRNYEDRYGLHFADATLCFPDYNSVEINAKVCLDTLESDSAALTCEQQNALYAGVSEDYSHLGSKKKIWDAVREDKYFNALQLKYANAVTCHKSQGGQWDCVFIDCPFWMDSQTVDDAKWLYTALTRAVKQVYLVNFDDRFFF